jgi:RND family efflux transporter MFP subunit
MFFQANKVPYVIFSFIILFILGCDNSAPAHDKKEIIRPAKVFTVADPSKEAIRNFPAEVEANAASKLAFRVSGQVIAFPIKPGNTVEKGDVLARLDPKDFELQLDDRQARYNLAKSKFDQAKLLLARKLGSQAGFDEAKANLGVALSSLNVAKSNLEYTYLHAPFSGNISKVFIKKFDHIQAKQPIIDLQTRDIIDISIQMPESIISRVNKDSTHQPTVIFDTHPNQEFLATIKEWDTQADSSTLTYKVVFSLPTPQGFNALPGMSANIRIDLSKIIDLNVQKFILPISAVFSAEDQPLDNHKKFVWKVNPNTMTVNRVEVKVGEVKSTGIEVLSGLVAEDQVVAAGSHFLSEGMQIRPWNREKGL